MVSPETGVIWGVAILEHASTRALENIGKAAPKTLLVEFTVGVVLNSCIQDIHAIWVAELFGCVLQKAGG